MPHKSNTPLVLALVGAGLVAAVGLCGVGGLIGYRLHRPAAAGDGSSPPTAATQDAPKAGRAMSRQEFEQLVTGKTGDEIIALLGRPAEAKDGASRFYQIWRYDSPGVINPVTGKPYSAAYLRIEHDSRCSGVSY